MEFILPCDQHRELVCRHRGGVCAGNRRLGHRLCHPCHCHAAGDHHVCLGQQPVLPRATDRKVRRYLCDTLQHSIAQPNNPCVQCAVECTQGPCARGRPRKRHAHAAAGHSRTHPSQQEPGLAGQGCCAAIPGSTRSRYLYAAASGGSQTGAAHDPRVFRHHPLLVCQSINFVCATRPLQDDIHPNEHVLH